MLVNGGRVETVEAEGPDRIRSIAVLPLVNLSGDPSQDYFADGMTEALITDLAKIRMLRVISRTSVMRYKGIKQALPSIARELGVQAILEGSVIREDDRFRITVQLIDARNDSHLWAENYDREITGVLALQSDVARAVAAQIQIELTPGEERQLSGSHEIDPEVYESYLRGRYAWNRRSAAGFEEALRHFQAAVERDPKFALGYTGLAATYDQQGVYGLLTPRETVRRIRSAVMKALDLDPELGEAHVSLADMHWWQWEWPEVERELRHALELNPSYATGHAWFAYLHCVLGREAESLVEIGRAMELDPLSSPVRADAAQIYFFSRRFEEAIEHALAAIRIDPDLAGPHAVLSLIYAQQGQHREAIEAGRTAVHLSGGADYETGWLAYSLARAGATDEAKLLVADLEQRSQRRYVEPTYIANAYAGLGNRDEIFFWLERAYREGSLWLTWINSSPIYDEVRDDPRFQAILERMGVAN
jgi:TolB-like protein/Tfp pilus assembly protein PilF